MSNYTVSATKIVTEQRLLNIKDEAEKAIACFLSYPDLLVDMLPKTSNFQLFFYQRIFLRSTFRFRYVYATFTRAYSKSFLSILALYLRCMLLPGSKLFICANVKEQAAKIATEKIRELWDLCPMLENEMSTQTGKRPVFEKDYVRLTFKNGSVLDVVGVLNSTRGGRRHAGLVEEVAHIDGDELNSVVIPLMNISRRNKMGIVNPREKHQTQLYVTTAGYQNTFAYDKLIQLAVWSVVRPGSAFIWGGDYKIPVTHGLMQEEFIEELKQDTTFKEDTFAREYLSRWSRSHEQAFFALDKLNRHRKIIFAEYQTTNKADDSFYILSVDVGRLQAQTVITVFRVNRRETYFLKNLVNIYTFQDMHFSAQACKIKELASVYNAQRIAIDGNGLGVGLLDYMIQTNTDAKGRIWAPIGSLNDDDMKKKQPHDAPALIYVIKGNPTLTSEIHINAATQINAGKVRFLVDEKAAKTKLLSLKRSQTMTPEQKMMYLMPYQLTSILIDEMLNLKQRNVDMRQISLERMSRRLGQDKFSSFEYGLWCIKEMEEAHYRKARRKGDFAKFIMMS